MVKKPTATNLRRNCDDRMRAHITARGECQRCGRTDGPFECAHILRRGKSWVRTDERNAWCLCKWCHSIVDLHQSQFMALVADTIGWELFLELEEKSKLGSKEFGNQRFDWAVELERWKAMT